MCTLQCKVIAEDSIHHLVDFLKKHFSSRSIEVITKPPITTKFIKKRGFQLGAADGTYTGGKR